MNEAWKELLDRHPGIDSGRLLAYLEGRLSDGERHEVEKQMAESAFLSEAMEGLEGIRDSKRIAPIVGELNSALKGSIRRGRNRRGPKSTDFPGWLALATLLVIALAAIAFLVYRMLTGG